MCSDIHSLNNELRRDIQHSTSDEQFVPRNKAVDKLHDTEIVLVKKE